MLKALPGVVRVHPFYIANAIVVDVASDAERVMAALTSHPDIKSIEPNRPFAVDLESPDSDLVARDLMMQTPDSLDFDALVDTV